MCVNLSDDKFRKPSHRKLTFAHGLSAGNNIRVKFIYEGYRVEVKVTATDKVQNPDSHTVKLPLGVTASVTRSAVNFALIMGFSSTADRMV